MYPNNQITPETELLAKQYNLKRLIKKESNRWALTTVIANAVITVIIAVISVIVSFNQALSDAYTSPVGKIVLQMCYSALMFSVPYLMVALISRKKVSSLISVKPPRFGVWAPLVMVTLGAAMVINLVVSQFTNILNSFNLLPEMPDMPIPEGVGGVALYLFTISVMPAIFEEFAFRGVILGALKPYGSGFAILTSSLLFGLMHGNFVQIPFAALLGCVFGYITVMTGSILPAVIAHFLNNFISGVQSVVDRYCDQAVSTTVSYAIFILYLIIGIVGLIIICRQYKHPFAPIREKSVLTIGQSFKLACSSGGFITSFIYFGGTACLFLLETSTSAI